MTIMTKERKETLKTIVIAVLISSIIAFVAGVRYEKSQQADLQSALKQAQVK